MSSRYKVGDKVQYYVRNRTGDKVPEGPPGEVIEVEAFTTYEYKVRFPEDAITGHEPDWYGEGNFSDF